MSVISITIYFLENWKFDILLNNSYLYELSLKMSKIYIIIYSEFVFCRN